MRALRGERSAIPPLWLMRQAGRYLPEYRELRAKAGGFLEFCYTPALAAEATLQPIRRFGFDAAILFSDILVIPDALGQRVRFVEGEGPRLDAVTDPAALASLTGDPSRLDAVLETAARVRGSLGPETAVIGFCGAPWTVASYMIAGKGTPDQAPIRLTAYRDADFLQAMIDRVIEASARYLVGQIDAGVDAVQIFESFGGALPPALFERWSFEPIMRLVRHVKHERPRARVIVFARGVGDRLTQFAAADGIDAIGLDWSIDPAWAAETLQPRRTVQGNLDPLALIAGGDALDAAVARIRGAFGEGPHIFNLGHGILPETPLAHVERLVARVRAPGNG
ncbi:uroporphyrinogen decarboxylase [Chelatococcus reniformis]|nr:uroporphyrinogen decarboxylase [Chelatococcus reniformis]